MAGSTKPHIHTDSANVYSITKTQTNKQTNNARFSIDKTQERDSERDGWMRRKKKAKLRQRTTQGNTNNNDLLIHSIFFVY